MTEGTTGHPIVQAFLRGDPAAVLEALAEDAVFHSPVTDYRGRGHIAPVLRALARVLTDAAATSVHGDAEQTVAFFTATVAERRADGVIRVVAEPGAPATELTLMIRPLDALHAGIKAMQHALEAP